MLVIRNNVVVEYRREYNQREIIIPDNVVAIKRRVFQRSDIEKVVVPEGVTRIEAETFAGASKLKQVVLPGSINYIGRSAFEGCRSLKSIDLLHTNVQVIDEKAFLGSGLVELRSDAQIIEEQAFFGCCDLRHIILEKAIVIGKESFASCRNLQSVELGESMISIADFAFAKDKELKEFYIPNSVEDLGIGITYGIENLSVDVSEKLKDHTEHYYKMLEESSYPKDINEGYYSVFEGKAKIQYRKEEDYE